MYQFVIIFNIVFLCCATAGFTQESATTADNISVVDGFQIELVYSVPREEQGSWICMALDDNDRFIFSDQRGPLYRMTLAETNSPPDVQQIEADIGQAHGLLWAHDSLYVTVNGDAAKGTGLYRLTDTDNDDHFDQTQQLISFSKANSKTRFKNLKLRIQNLLISSGHGPHGIVLGPDDRLYLVGGNHTVVPDKIDPLSPFRNWNEDLLLQRIPDSQGIATGIMAPGGWVIRLDKDGSNMQLICGGLRNAYDLAFNADDELLTFDSDMEFDSGMPWYVPCQVNHIVSAGEYGWRYGSGKWPGYFVDSVDSVVDVGLASPAGMTFGYAAEFPDRYRNALFVTDWAYGKILAVHLEPKGSTYTANYEAFATGKPLAVVDMLVHPDGCLYFLTGGRNSQSGVYRIRYIGSESTTRRIAIDESAANLRSIRRRLESYHSGMHEISSAQIVEFVWPFLSHADRFIRYAARIAIERQPSEVWIERAKDETKTDAIIQSMVALVRSTNTNHREIIVNKLCNLPFNTMHESQQLDTLRTIALALIRLPELLPAERDQFEKKLLPLFPSQSRLINRELSRLLVFLQSEKATEKIIQQINRATIQEDQIFFGFVLRLMKVGWNNDLQEQYFSWLHQVYKRYQGGSGFDGFVRRILSDVSRRLSKVDQKKLRKIVTSQDETSEPELPRQFTNNWQLSQLEPLLPGAMKNGTRSYQNGHAAYFAAQCNKCHRIAGQGGVTGPDLTGAGNRFSDEYMLDAILQPSKVIPDQYRHSKFILTDGEYVTGRVVAENSDHLELRINPYSTNTRRIEIEQIDSQSLSNESEMPIGLINVLNEQEILDLLAYLRSGGNPDDPVFETAENGNR